jgi:MYXO-CTERM domain-containing protein
MRRTLIALALATAGMAQAATVTVFNSLAAWEAAISGSAQLQDFSGYPDGTDLTGVAVLPGVTLSSNLGPVEVFGPSLAAVAFGPARSAGTAYYEAQYALPFRAVALDLIAYESIPGDGSTAVDTGLLSLLFSDGSIQDLAIAGGDGANIFIGIIADLAVTSLRWTEAHEASGGNEESGLDNLRVAMRGNGNTVPLPGTLALAMLALAALPLTRRRR